MHTKEFLDFGLSILDETGSLILKKIQEGFVTEMKIDKTVVTAIDREVEDFIKNKIIKRYPDHNILGEEHGAINKNSDYLWLIDPIDGTEAFVRGSKDYGTLLALQYKNKTVLGIIDHPGYGLRYYAYANGGAYRNGIKISLEDIADSSDIKNEVIAVCRKGQFERHEAMSEYEKILQMDGNVKEISDCYGHTRVLEGEIGAMIDYNLSLWDIEATRILTEESGGKFVVKDVKKNQDGKVIYGIVFGKPKVVDWLCKSF